MEPTVQTATTLGTMSAVNATQKGVMLQPISADEKFVLDSHVSGPIPSEKVTFVKRWSWKPKGTDNTLQMGNVSWMDKISNLKWSSGAMTDSEIHIIYLPHIPIDNFRDKNVQISLNFEGTDEDECKEISRAEFPSSLHTHIIFYPGHSFSLRAGSIYPWSITMTTEASIKDSYILADVFVQFKAYNTPISRYSDKRGVNIISLVPFSESPTGVALTRPRIGTDWKVVGLQYGVRQGKDIRILQRMQTAGVDVEGLQVLGLLSSATKRVKGIIAKCPANQQYDLDKQICRATLSIVRNKRI